MSNRQFYAFQAWYLLGRAGWWKHVGYERSAALSVDHRLTFAIVGRLLVLAHNTKWRLSIVREIFRKHPRITLEDHNE